MYYIEAAGQAIKEMFSPHDFVWAALNSTTPEARELRKRWQTVFAKYANLAKRYWNIVKQFQALRLEPAKLHERYAALDKEFDDVCREMDALHADLHEWARSNPGIVRRTITR
jgi:hypothetical protein